MPTLPNLLLCLFLVAPVSAFAKTPLLIDTDMAIDDWLAMIYLGHHPDAEILAITVTGAGEAHCDPGAQNAVDLIDLTPARGTPVACGPSEPMDGFQEFPKSWRKDADTLYGVSVNRSPRQPEKESAPDLMIQTLRKAIQPVHLVILGNATNVALALDKAPDIKTKIARIFFMGGSIWEKGNIIVPGFTDHFHNKVAEWNVLIDPIAARKVLRSGVPLTLVSLDGTKDQKVTRSFVAHFQAAAESQGAKFFSKILTQCLWFVDSGEYYLWDTLTAALSLNPSFCRTEPLPVDVIVGYSPKTNGDPLPAFSPLRWDGKPRRNFDPYFTGQTFLSDEGPVVDVCVESFADALPPALIRTINRL